MITRLDNAADLIEAGNTLKEIDRFLTENTKKRTAFCKALASQICEYYILFHELSDKKYFVSSHSIPLYLLFNGLTNRYVRDSRMCIKMIIDYIDEYIVPASGNCITKDDINNILNLLDQKFPYFNVVGVNQPLIILTFKNSSRIYNSFFCTDASRRFLIINMLNMMDNDTSPEYVFLHELGHALQLAITGSMDNVPGEFISFQNDLSGVEPIEQDDPNAPDLFADSFAIAVMNNTPLKKHDPFNFHEELNRLLEQFFMEFIKKYAC